MAENDNINLEITEAIVEAVSPTATVSKVGDTATITVTDKNGTTTASVKDGDKGDKGDQGDKGDKGDKGDTGNTGATGATPELSIGTVSTLGPGEPATATITGTDEQPVLNLGIPHGAKGDTGNTGAAAGFGTVSASVDANVGTPAVSVTASGPNTAKNIAFAFSNLKGAKGDTGATGNGIESIYLTGTSGAVKTYTILFTDGNTTTFDVTDGEVTNASLATILEDYARINGAYESMTVGNAEQLISSVTVNDKVPYNFRTSGGSIDIGNREVDKLVGGTVAWNQLADSDAFVGQTASVSTDVNHVTTVTTQVAGGFRGVRFIQELIAGHKYLIQDKNSDTSRDVLTVGRLTSAMDWFSAGAVTYLQQVPKGGPLSLVINAVSGGLYASTWPDSTASYTMTFDKFQVFDLTQMFGSTIADYIYSLEQGTAGAGVAWFKKLFPKPYYAYNAGELMSVKTSAHQMVGFNAWDIATAERIKGGYNSSVGTVLNTDDSPVSTTGDNPLEINIVSAWQPITFVSGKLVGGELYQITADVTVSSGADGKYTLYLIDDNYKVLSKIGVYSGMTGTSHIVHTVRPTANGQRIALYLSDAENNRKITVANCCLHLVWDGERDGEYEAYKKWTYPLDSDLELRGIPKLDSANNLYYDGDTYEDDGTVNRRFGIVDLGTKNFTYYASDDVFYTTISDMNRSNKLLICDKYLLSSQGAAYINNMECSVNSGVDTTIWFKNTAYTDATAFKAAMDGVYLVYELATPTTEEADPYQNPQIVDDFGTEEYVDERTVAIPVGHDTEYMNNLKAKLEMAPDSPDGDGDYIVRQTNGENSYVPLMKELPNAPSEDGTYTLKCTVASGTATLGWEREE